VFSQLISEHRPSAEELDIFTDGSKIIEEDNKCRVGCTVSIPGRDIIHKLKLNDMTSSYIAEVFTIDNLQSGFL